MQLITGDAALVLKEMAAESIDLTVTSPPYDELRTYNGYCFDFETIAKELWRITKQGGVVVWIVADGVVDGSETGSSFKQALTFMAKGFRLHDTMIWHKDSFSFPEATRYPQTFEYMFVFSKGVPKTHNLLKDRRNKWAGSKVHGSYRNKDGSMTKRNNVNTFAEYGLRHNVWEMSPEKNNITGHPAVFPFDIPRDHIRTWTNPGDVVLDPFLGSGTTGLAAYDTGRHFIGIEISAEYMEIAKRRIEDAMAQVKMEI